MKAGGIFLIVVASIVSVLVLFFTIVALIKFQHPDDRNQAWLPKIIVVIGYYLCFMTSMIVPFDVSNSTSQLKLHIDVLWYIGLLALCAYLFIIIPFAFFWYENQGVDEDVPPDVRPGILDTQLGSAIIYTVCYIYLIFLYMYISLMNL